MHNRAPFGGLAIMPEIIHPQVGHRRNDAPNIIAPVLGTSQAPLPNLRRTGREKYTPVGWAKEPATHLTRLRHFFLASVHQTPTRSRRRAQQARLGAAFPSLLRPEWNSFQGSNLLAFGVIVQPVRDARQLFTSGLLTIHKNNEQAYSPAHPDEQAGFPDQKSKIALLFVLLSVRPAHPLEQETKENVMKILFPLALIIASGGCATTGSLTHGPCGAAPKRPEFSCETPTQSKQLAYGYCARRTLGCKAGSLLLRHFNPGGVSPASGSICDAEADKALRMDATIGALVSDASFKLGGWYLRARSHPVLAGLVWVGEKGYEFYGCQSQVSTLCQQRYQKWQAALRAQRECVRKAREFALGMMD